MRLGKLLQLLFVLFIGGAISITHAGCANIGQPTGGPRDSLAPVLEKATPAFKSVNVTSDRLVFNFDEYVEVADAQTNVIVSPLQLQTPTIRSNFKTVTVKFRDTLQPNTTYTINFGDAIKDLNEGNVLKNFSYTFSTGPYIDSLSLSGKVILAETGLTDTTVQVYLYQNGGDSAILKQRPKYISRLNSVGEFSFTNLPGGNYHVYALKDGDGGKTYNSKAEMFAFLPQNELIKVQDSTAPITLFAYEEDKRASNQIPTPGVSGKGNKNNVLRITTSADPKQDILSPFKVYFSNPLIDFPEGSLVITDTNYKALPDAKLILDSTRKTAMAKISWRPGEDYLLLIKKEGIKDSLNNNLFKSDTVRFSTKRQEDYGKIILRFTNIKLEQHPVLQLLQGEQVRVNYSLTSSSWQDNRFPPGEYTIRILYDENANGIWDPGDFKTYKQPEHAVTFPQKLSIRADWENEREITL